MNCPFLFRCSLMLVLIITGPLVFAQSSSENNNAEYTITKRLLSIEDGLASHEVFCGLQDKLASCGLAHATGLIVTMAKIVCSLPVSEITCRKIKLCNWQKMTPTTCLLNMAVRVFNSPPMARWM